MAPVKIIGLHKRYGAVPAVRGVDLNIADGEFTVLVGPSGCGKSTLLRTIAGLEELSEGTIEIGGRVVNEMRPKDRDVAMVFQDYALYPHMTVANNIGFGLKARKVPKTDIETQVRGAAKMLGIEALLERYPRQLSGGQRQRVAIGRAIVRNPQIFLFDEPLSNLDAQLRDEMRSEIKRLHQELGATMIYVTHDQIEAMTLADRIVLMNAGQIEQAGTPLDLYERPATRFVAGFLGSPKINFIPATLVEENGVRVKLADGQALALPEAHQSFYRSYIGRPIELGVRPQHVVRATKGRETESLKSTIELLQPTGSRTFVTFRVVGVPVVAELDAHDPGKPGDAIEASLDMRRAVFIDRESGRVLRKLPSRAVQLFGTEEAVETPRVLKAGDLTAELEAGSLRYVRYRGFEVMRAVSFIVRDANWATYNPLLSNLKVEEKPDAFHVTYDASVKDAKQELRYSAKIEGHADGRLSFSAQGEPASEFLTNRCGFVVLHAVDGVAGAPATVEEVNGKIVETKFPELISPSQPIFNIRAITHEFAPGAKVTCRMEGDTFEMEDQRNWMDASYKTYVRPLSQPWPYTLAPGVKLDQRVTLTVEGSPKTKAAATGGISIEIGAGGGKLPSLGVGLAPEDAAGSLVKADILRKAAPAYVVCHYDRRTGHGRKSLEDMVAVARALGATPWLEAIVTKVEGFEDEIVELGKTVAAMGSPFKTVMLSPAPDLKSTQPTGPWAPCPPLEEVYKLARKNFPGARIGGGMFSFFTELNRKRPPHELLDFVSFTTSSLVHSGDDRSVTEGLEALPYMARSVNGFARNKPFAVGPSAIGMRFNPYGAAPVGNPTEIRQAMNRNDPRQHGLLGAAWYLAYYAHFAYSGAEAVALGGLTGPFGIIHARADYPLSWFDEAGGLYPVFHVLRGLSRLAGGALRKVSIDAPREVQALAVEKDGKREVWIANLTGEPVKVMVGGVSSAKAAVLDASNFIEAAMDAEHLDRTTAIINSDTVELDAYAVMRILI